MWASLGVLLILGSLFFFWPKKTQKDLGSAHPELVGGLFEGKPISEGLDPTRELVSRDIGGEEEMEIAECSGLSNLTAGSLVIGGESYSYLKGCCLMEEGLIQIHMAKVGRAELTLSNLTAQEIQTLGETPNKNLPLETLSIDHKGMRVGVEKCLSVEHNLSDATKGMSLLCESNYGTVRIKFRCEDYTSLEDISF